MLIRHTIAEQATILSSAEYAVELTITALCSAEKGGLHISVESGLAGDAKKF